MENIRGRLRISVRRASVSCGVMCLWWGVINGKEEWWLGVMWWMMESKGDG